MAIGVIDDSILYNIGDAIRSKNSGTTTYLPSEMPAAIQAIQTGVDTSDATATASDMAEGVTAYVNGEKVTGTVKTYDGMAVISNRVPTLNGETELKLQFSTSVPYLFRNGLYASSPLSNFGDATAADVIAEKTFTSANGLNTVGTTPIISSKAFGNLTPSLHGASNAVCLQGEFSERTAIESGSIISMYSKLHNFGDATPEDVRAGKTFTSGSGLNKVGTASIGSGKTLVAKSGTTTTASFDTGLSEIEAVYISGNSTSVGLVNATILALPDIVTIAGCSSYSAYMKTYSFYSSTISAGKYAKIEGGTVSFVATTNSIKFVSNENYTWYALGYE